MLTLGWIFLIIFAILCLIIPVRIYYRNRKVEIRIRGTADMIIEAAAKFYAREGRRPRNLEELIKKEELEIVNFISGEIVVADSKAPGSFTLEAPPDWGRTIVLIAYDDGALGLNMTENYDLDFAAERFGIHAPPISLS